VKSDSIKFLSELNQAQQRAVETTEGPVLVLAGAGSGKTRVLTYRYAYLVGTGKTGPQNILAMTFTNKAAREMKERIQKLVGVQTLYWIGTFHSICARILRREHSALSYSKDFVIYDTDDQQRLIKSIMDQDAVPFRDFTPKSIASVISRCKNRMILPEEFSRNASSAFEQAVAGIYPVYESSLRKNQAFDFDDLLLMTLRIFEDRPGILLDYQKRFHYIMVDEYQDTNRVQFLLLKRLAELNRNLCVVGDDDQSIYRWRGADIQNILEFETHFRDASVFRLEQNYRSTRLILRAANSLVEKNAGRKGKRLWSEKEEGEKIEILEAMDEIDEAQKIVEQIKEEVFRGKRIFKQFAILYRTNAQSRAIEDRMRRNGLSYVIVGGVRFYDRKEVKDVLAYLKLIVNTSDSVSLHRVVNFPTRGIGEVSWKRIVEFAAERNMHIFDVLQIIDKVPGIGTRAVKNILAFVELIRKYINLKNQISPNELVRTLVDEVGLLRMYKSENTIESQGKAENVQELLSAVSEYAENTPSPTLAGFLEEVSLVSDVDTWDDKSNAITLMTLHCAKGLEFPVVFITGLEEGLFPVYRSLDDKEALEEERRLFYVGMTRACDRLFISWAGQRRLFIDSNYRLPSRFLNEIDQNLLHVRKKAERHERWMEGIHSTGKESHDEKSDPHPAYEDYSQETRELVPGAWVKHEEYGKGQIRSVEGSGEKLKIRVYFKGEGEKKFMVQYARFTLL